VLGIVRFKLTADRRRQRMTFMGKYSSNYTIEILRCHTSLPAVPLLPALFVSERLRDGKSVVPWPLVEDVLLNRKK
jgi:hypothetical protein